MIIFMEEKSDGVLREILKYEGIARVGDSILIRARTSPEILEYEILKIFVNTMYSPRDECYKQGGNTIAHVRLVTTRPI